MGTLRKLDTQKADLNRTLKMLESLSRERRIDINARIETLYNEELLEESRKFNAGGLDK